jgi:hypothetical protein
MRSYGNMPINGYEITLMGYAENVRIRVESIAFRHSRFICFDAFPCERKESGLLLKNNEDYMCSAADLVVAISFILRYENEIIEQIELHRKSWKS